MDLMQAPVATSFDAAAATVSLLAYLAVAIGAVVTAPNDSRARAFLALAASSAFGYAVSPLQWWRGSVAASRPVIAAAAVALALGAVVLFHFTQIFPRRRPWIRHHGRWLTAAYAALPPAVAVVAWNVASMFLPAGGDDAVGAIGVSMDLTLALLVLLMLPLLFIAGMVLPFGGVMSLFKSWQEAKAAGDAAAQTTTFWMLMSQMAGGVLTIVVVPLLSFVGIRGVWATLIAALTYAFGLLMPATFAAAVWRYRMLNTSA
jgi:hypothetical protein